MNYLKPTALGIAVITALSTIAAPVSAAGLDISYSEAFSDDMQETYMRVANRISNLDDDAQARLYSRIDTFKTRYSDMPVIVQVLEYIKRDAMMDSTTIADLAMANDDLSILVELVVAADLTDVLMDDMKHTVFAPTNMAFENALDMLGMTLEELKSDKMRLKSLLMTHILMGSVYSDQVMMMDDMSTVMSAEGTYLRLKTSGTPMIDDAGLVMTDMVASNGVVHVIDSVLLPDMLRDMEDRSSTIADLAMNNDSLTVLLDLVQTAGLTEVLMDEDMNITVFAPNDQAFMNYLEMNNKSLADVKADPDMLAEVLKYHIIQGSVTAEMAMMMDDGSMVETLEGSSLTLSTDGELMIDDAMVTSADMYARNGIVHVIDTVLKPGM